MVISSSVSPLIGFQSHGKSIKGSITSPMWFLVQVLIAIHSKLEQDLILNHNIRFQSDYMIQTGWYQLYLNEQQVSYLTEKGIARIYPIQSKEKYFKKNIQSQEKIGDYIVRSIPNWQTEIEIHSQITEDIYIVRNVSKRTLMNDPQVLSAHKMSEINLRNRYINGNIQSGKTQVEFDQEYVRIPTPLWNQGLSGKNQVINIIDTGCDVYNPMFYDFSNELPVNKVNTNHRKIVRYDALADSTDSEDGHGTHVAGTALGNPSCTDCGLKMYRGVAPEAKLYFVDFADSITSNITVYPNMKQVVQNMREVKSKISSNSWGIAGVNLQNTHAFDKLAYENPDILFLIAAGNSGSFAGGEPRYMSIESPADSKNVICVGNVAEVKGQFVENQDMRQYLFYDDSNPNNFVDVKVSQYGKDIWKETETNYKTWIKNSNVVEHTSNNIDNNVFVYTGLIKDLCPSIKKALTSKPSAIVLPIFTKSCFESLKRESIDPSQAFIFINDNPGSLTTLSKMKTTTLQVISFSEKQYSMRDSSSKGETIYGNSKPDVSAIGTEVISARSGSPYSSYFRGEEYSKALSKKTGTSMSTPAIAGAAALIRQFFEEGLYPSKTKTDASKYDPSGILLKGILVNSATKITSTGSDPSIFDGYGIPNLEYGLGYLPGCNLFFVDNVKMPSKDHHIYKIKISKSQSIYDLQITLVYNDPPVDPSKSYRFYADLNLYVESPKKDKVLYGNDAPFGDADYFASIEKVIISNRELEDGEYIIHVVSSEYPGSDEVNYSLVVNGPAESNLSSDNSNKNTCPKNCGEHGECVNGRCQCKDNYYGNQCDRTMDIASSYYSSNNIRSKDVRYAYYNVVGEISENNPLTVKFGSNSKYGKPTFCYMTHYGRLADKNTTCTDQSPLIITNNLKANEKIYFASYVPATQFETAMIWAQVERSFGPVSPGTPVQSQSQDPVQSEPELPFLPVVPENPAIAPQTPNQANGQIPTIPPNPGEENNNDDSNGKGLGGGAIAGIAVGSVAAVGASVGAVLFVLKRKPHLPVGNAQIEP